MRQFFSDSLHLFIIFMMVVFIIGAILALTGNFDHWTERYRLKRRRRRLIRDKSRKQPKADIDKHGTPYYSTRPDKETTSGKGKYA
ncbi:MULTISPECIES: hypothetical protein [unclassified Mucilaginibacter]|uniref:hypothetical protein n=1 Tax=unclassified Mucilaginibacter TaxID=2617802 RepID=UPI002AC9A90C|nr:MULTISPECIES: hypothetical protein [unclassified Mucilaginibacter]MEB0263402.1 hypothetical protein [Mucilaginibacter sp. 10I4]MEB0278569.1 hypothetical protein [Mucilaginibacter sp. 10B2]MEB0299280.1 hypothetical protein [Mucilaginibacter sp. 5C4]WPX23475.1 hypothetical protein RHM67_19555 [Mucilaginibacter sp. 5C4]